MNTITIHIPEEMMQRLQLYNQPLQSLLIEALNEYLDNKASTIVKTWELCGSLEVTEPKHNDWVEKDGKQYTNYAETLDQDLY
jgi:hypothetical protein